MFIRTGSTSPTSLFLWLTHYSERLHDVSVTFSRFCKAVLNSFFPRKAWLWNSLQNSSVLLFLVTPCLVVAAQSCKEWIPINIYTWSILESKVTHVNARAKRAKYLKIWANIQKSTKLGNILKKGRWLHAVITCKRQHIKI